jgi:hypothetical protein
VGDSNHHEAVPPAVEGTGTETTLYHHDDDGTRAFPEDADAGGSSGWCCWFGSLNHNLSLVNSSPDDN